MRIIIDKFDGVDNFIRTINSRKLNQVFYNKESLSSIEGTEDFTLTKSYDEACELMAKGYKEGLAELKKTNAKVTTSVMAQRRTPRTSVVGFAPHVPNAIIGLPQSMISTETVKMKSKIINLYFDPGVGGATSTDTILKAGRNLLNVIMAIETKGYRVSLTIVKGSTTTDEYAFLLCKLKDYRQPTNPLKIAYEIVHPSFLRRHCFAWLETTPNLTDKGFKHGYGKSLANRFKKDNDAVRKFLHEKHIIDEHSFYTNVYEASENSIEELMNKMGLSK